MRLVLPYPPSINHYWRHVGRKILISAAGRTYATIVSAAVRNDAFATFGPLNRLAVRLLVQPPDRRRRDLDNVAKPLLDALTKAGLWADDSQIDWLLIERLAAAKSAGVVIVDVDRLDSFHYTKAALADHAA